MPEFADPSWLALLVLVPVAAWLRRSGGTAESRGRRLAGTFLRCAALATLIVMAASPLAGSHSPDAEVILALDRSHSIGNESDAEALGFIADTLSAKPANTRVGVMVFATNAAMDALPGSNPDAEHVITSHVERAGTNVAHAIETATAAFGASGHRRLVLLSDGQENLGDARAAAAVARSLGVQVDAVTLHRPTTRPEVSVQGLATPERVHVHEPFRVTVNISSRERGRAHLVLLRNGAVVHERSLDLEPGTNSAVFVEQALRGGLHEYEAVVNAEVDGSPENNRYQSFVHVAGAPRVLHATGGAQNGDHFARALDLQGFAVDRIPAAAMPASMHRLSDYDLVVLDNVSGFDLSAAKMTLLESYVRDGGGGVIKLGGDRSYAAGGYYGTPVERLLPVTMDVKTTVKIPSLAVVFVLDRSGSMGSRSQGEEKITIAKNAALASIDLLNPLDRVGILAFDDTTEWIATPTEVGNRRPIGNRLRSLGAGGSTDLVGALDEAVRVMSEQEAKVKHLIVLSDGLTGTDANFEPLAERIQAQNITVSTVALGLDADRRLMSDLAQVGGGRFYATDDPQNVPRIFTSETMVVSRNLVVERPTSPNLLHAGELLEGFEAVDFPVLDGYQRAFAKPAAQVLLNTDDGDPLLAVWRFGLGKAVAFTSDLTGRWGHRWVTWQEFSRFVAQMARWSMRRRSTETLNPTFRWSDGQGHVAVDVFDGDERFINGLTLNASVLMPDRQAHQTTLEQVAPGRYAGRFPVPREGRYYITLHGRANDLQVGPKTFGLAVPYSSEYQDLGVNRDLLEDVTAATGGRVLSPGQDGVKAVLEPGPQIDTTHRRIWKPLLLAVLLLLVMEVAIRKLVLPETWLKRLGSGGIQDEGQAQEPEYQELRQQMDHARRRHLRALATGGNDMHDDATARARLYLSTASGRKR